MAAESKTADGSVMLMLRHIDMGGGLLPLLAVILLLIAGFLSLSSYSVTWDEALGDLFFGQRYLSFFTSLDPQYLDFDADPYPEGRIPDLGLSPFRHKPWEYYPLANTLAAAVSAVLSRGLRLLDPFDGYHAFKVLYDKPWKK